MSRLSLAITCCALMAAPTAQAAVYSGQFSALGGYVTGSFTGEDRNGDAQIDHGELIDFAALVANMNGGPGQFVASVSYADDFLFRDAGNGLGWLSGAVSYVVEQTFCGGWDQRPCEDDQAAAPLRLMAFGGYDAFSQWSWHSQRFETDAVSFMAIDPAPVPLPAGLPLMAAGVGALAVLRRRRRT